MKEIKVNSSPDFQELPFCKKLEGESEALAINFCRAIENADGVPFCLFFGEKIGYGHYLKVGKGIKQLFGIEPEEFTEKLFQGMIEKIILLDNDIPSDPVEIREKFITGGIQSYKAEVLVTLPGGEKKWILDSSLPLIDEETGIVMGLYGVFFDITLKKQNALQLILANERAKESDRLKSAFLNNLSHEIRTPLNAIVGFSTLLSEPGNVNETQLEYLDIITRSTDHLLEIIDDIVEISKIEAKAVKTMKKETDINAILQRVYDRFIRKAIDKNIILRYETLASDKDVIIMTDGFKLFQALTNLVGNAVKFTRSGRVEFGYNIKDDKIEFFVFDTGIGITHEHQANIFNTFYQVESSSTQRYEGTGLGLSISRAYIELLGGTIWVTSEPGEGSLFYFILPYEPKVNI